MTAIYPSNYLETKTDPAFYDKYLNLRDSDESYSKKDAENAENMADYMNKNMDKLSDVEKRNLSLALLNSLNESDSVDYVYMLKNLNKNGNVRKNTLRFLDIINNPDKYEKIKNKKKSYKLDEMKNSIDYWVSEKEISYHLNYRTSILLIIVICVFFILGFIVCRYSN